MLQCRVVLVIVASVHLVSAERKEAAAVRLAANWTVRKVRERDAIEYLAETRKHGKLSGNLLSRLRRLIDSGASLELEAEITGITAKRRTAVRTPRRK